MNEHIESILKGVGVMLATSLLLVAPALAQTGHFSEARETDEQLLEGYERHADLCLRNPNRDVEVAVACQSMMMYGMALNERGLCHGKENEANAFAEWHECQADSMYFPEVELPAGF